MPGIGGDRVRFALLVDIAPGDERAARNVDLRRLELVLVHHDRRLLSRALTGDPGDTIVYPVEADYNWPTDVFDPLRERVRVAVGDQRCLVWSERVEVGLEILIVRGAAGARTDVEQPALCNVHGEVQVVATVPNPCQPRGRARADIAGHVIVGKSQQSEPKQTTEHPHACRQAHPTDKPRPETASWAMRCFVNRRLLSLEFLSCADRHGVSASSVSTRT